MVDLDIIIKNYEKSLINDITFSKYLLGVIDNKNEMSLSVFRYAIENILKWNPIEVRDNLNEDIINSLKLSVFYKYINFPPELDKNKDYFYIAHLLYPSKITYNSDMYVYNKINDLILKNSKCKKNRKSKVQLMVLNDQVVLEKYIKTWLNINYSYLNAYEKYGIFSSKKIMEQYLKEEEIVNLINDTYDNPLDLINNIYHCEYLYNYYKFKEIMEE